MKPPRWPQSPTWKSRSQPESLSISGLAEHSPWAGPVVVGRPGHVSWRTTLSLLLVKVPIEPVAKRLWPTIEAIALQVLERLSEAHADARDKTVGATYFDWLSMWCEQFRHWNDPVRMLVAEHCTSGDAAIVAQHFQRFNGLAFVDFVVEAIRAHDERQMWHARMLEQALPEPSLPLKVPCPSNSAALDWVCGQLYADFQQQAPFSTCPARPTYNLTTLVADIYIDDDGRAPPAHVILWEDQL